eukprot:gene387-692_t
MEALERSGVLQDFDAPDAAERVAQELARMGQEEEEEGDASEQATTAAESEWSGSDE